MQDDTVTMRFLVFSSKSSSKVEIFNKDINKEKGDDL